MACVGLKGILNPQLGIYDCRLFQRLFELIAI